jgi:hypothetical protein
MFAMLLVRFNIIRLRSTCFFVCVCVCVCVFVGVRVRVCDLLIHIYKLQIVLPLSLRPVRPFRRRA